MTDITYKTEALVVLRDGMNKAGEVRAAWEKGGKHVQLAAHSDGVCLTPTQLQQLVELAPAILQDLKPQGDKANATLAKLASNVLHGR